MLPYVVTPRKESISGEAARCSGARDLVHKKVVMQRETAELRVKEEGPRCIDMILRPGDEYDIFAVGNCDFGSGQMKD